MRPALLRYAEAIEAVAAEIGDRERFRPEHDMLLVVASSLRGKVAPGAAAADHREQKIECA